MENGESVQLTDELGVRITLAPYPPVGLSAQVGLDLYLFDPAGEPVRDAAIEISYDMLSMPHGPFQSAISEHENGHYLISLDLIMFGAWGLEIQILPDRAAPARLRIVVVLALPEE